MNYIFRLIDYNGVEYKIELNSRSSMFSFNMLARIKDNLPSGTMIRTLFLPEGISSIDKMAFNVIGEEIKTLYLPSTVTTINGQAFYGPLKLEYIFVCEDNTHFSSDINGVLFDKNKSILIRYPVGKNDDIYEIPQVKEIAPCAFSHTKIKFLSAPKSVSVIGEQAFMYSQLISADLSKTKIDVLPKQCFWICSDLVYVKLPENLKSIKIMSFCQCGFKNIEIPNTVAKIEKYAFSSSKIKEIKMPRDIKHITRDIFKNCESIEKIDLCNAIRIHKTAFTDCPSLSEITVSTDNKAFSTTDGILYNKDFTKLYKIPPACNKQEFVVPDSVKIIDEAAFDSCANFSEVNIGNATLENSGFYNCFNLRKIIIGADCKEFSPEKVKLCFALEEISVAPDNPYYKSNDGVLFDRSGEKLILYPPAKKETTYTVPGGTKEISAFAFYNNQSLREVKLPKSLMRIGNHAFEHCDNLESINLSNVSSIGLRAFAICKLLDDITIDENTIVEGYCFAFCSSLKNVLIKDNENIGDNVFMLTPFSNNSFFISEKSEQMINDLFIEANILNFILTPRGYFRNYWGM